MSQERKAVEKDRMRRGEEGGTSPGTAGAGDVKHFRFPEETRAADGALSIHVFHVAIEVFPCALWSALSLS